MQIIENECDDFETTSVIERVKEFVSCFVFDLTDEGITKLDKFLNGARERFDNGEPDVAFVFEKVGDGDLELLSNVFEDDFLNALFLIKVGKNNLHLPHLYHPAMPLVKILKIELFGRFRLTRNVCVIDAVKNPVENSG